MKASIKLNTTSQEYIFNLFGPANINLNILEDHFSSYIQYFNTKISISGMEKDIIILKPLLEQLWEKAKSGIEIDKEYLKKQIYLAKNMSLNNKSNNNDFNKLADNLKKLKSNEVILNKHLNFKYLSINQKNFIEAIKNNIITFGIGPAGTGKTFLAIAYALNELLNNNINQIILSRPILSAGENLGFLPGTFNEKIDPYLRPLFDSMHKLMNFESINNMINKNIIELAPIAYMRGRTFNNCCAILDEAQNMTIQQMKMVLTRIGSNSKLIITGDIQQSDLPESQAALKNIQDILKNIEDIYFFKFKNEDIVRNPLVSKILNAYSKYQNKGNEH